MKKSIKEQREEIAKMIAQTDEQLGVAGMPEELKNITVTIRNLIKLMNILLVLAVVMLAAELGACIDNLTEYLGAPSPETADKLGGGIMLFFAIGAAAAIAAVLKNIFKAIEKSGTPFIPQVSKGIRKITAVICFMFVFQGLAVVVYPMLTGGGDPTLYFNWTSFIFVSVLELMGYIFDYGCKLQKESDETL
ncbi:MAG: hypothetical protein NC253_06395 [Ruminococcus sp.]|nr:hypothetical protein [Ruminococcus sp.]MCM1381511.1 hypothetical protein [Muribaculaceae bacterium]MCM1480865.1 hypothetical protein [Muribaculaceae bacterium]